PNVALWTAMPSTYYRMSRQARFLSTIARLKPGVSLPLVRSELKALGVGLGRSYPESNRGWGVTILPLEEKIGGGVRRSACLLQAAVGCILLIARANVQNLLLAPRARRQSETAILTALGASSMRLYRQIITESLLLATISAAAGLILCWGSLKVLEVLHPPA